MMSTLELSGSWKIRWSDGQRGRLEHALRNHVDEGRWIDAIVPGEVHLDLMRAGLIDDPYIGTNVLSARWVEEFRWTYRRTFHLDEIPKGRCWLVFEGLDLAATIFLNGELIGTHSNFFYPCRIEVTGRLRAAENVIHVHLDSGLWSVADKPSVGWEHWPDQTLNKRHWLRKPQCQFGWDWAQRLVNVGIHKPVRLEWTDAPARIDQLVALAQVSDDLQHASVRVRMFVEGFAPHDAQLTVEIPELGMRQSSSVQVKEGLQAVESTVEVKDFELWWPVGHGPQPRYSVKATLTRSTAEGGCATRETKIGFRHVRVDQSPHPDGGRYFTFIINGRKIFMKGGNFVPADMIFARLDRSRYETLIDLAIEQNLNFLRVWGGGLYESDDFYELCDERGILVWQEFIFACSRYPTTDEAFFNDVKREAIWNIRRLASHPSLIAWCGNNEIEWGDWDWDYGHKGVIMPDHAFYHITLPRLLSEEDPTRYYQPSSPYSPDRMHPNDDRAGDQHPWSVGFFNYDFRKYREMKCRFPDEGGMLGPTSLPTMLACLPKESDRHVNSFAFQIHDNSVTTWTHPHEPDEYIRRWTGKDPRAMSIEEFTYWAGLLQGEGLREYVENFRRRMFDSSAAVFWMFNDCWPATRSWTTVDYYLRRTPAFYAVRRAMAPVHVVLAQENEVGIFGINDTTEAVEAELAYGIFQLSGATNEHRQNVALPPNSSTRLATIAARDWMNSTQEIPFATLRRDDRVIARNRLISPMFSELRWPRRPQLSVSVKDGNATFSSSAFAWGVCLDLDGELPLSDNFFDMYPDQPHVIRWTDLKEPRIRFFGNL